MGAAADVEAAAQITRRGREILFQMLESFEQRGVRLIEADTDGVYFSVPEEWSIEQELALVGRSHVSGGTPQEARPQAVFELGDPSADGRLGHA